MMGGHFHLLLLVAIQGISAKNETIRNRDLTSKFTT
jgi:hypothetical protein